MGVKLYGTWNSLYCAMVHSALKLKGVAYDYFEEDLGDKSDALLRLNPVHKKVPVLAVDGRPVAESLIILEFAEDVWKEPALLPEDPYLRARIRFWADFIYQKLVPRSYAIMLTKGEAQERAAKEFIDNLLTLEDGITKDFSTTGTFVHGERPGFLDVIVGSFSSGFRVLSELVGMELLQKERMPVLSSAVAAFAEMEEIKETMIPYEKLLKRVQEMREQALAVST